MARSGTWRFLAGTFLLLVWLPAAAAVSPAAPAAKPTKPRELSAAERAAVELAAAYLHQGPEAWLPRLQKSSPLGRLPAQEARQEILARVGPPEGSTWHLVTPGPLFDDKTAVFAIDYASGLDETLILRLVDQGGWKIAAVRTSIDRAGSRAAPWRTGEAAAAPARESQDETADGASLSGRVSWGGALAAVAALILGGLGAWLGLRKGRRPLAIAAACGAAVAIALGAWGTWGLGSRPAPPPAEADAGRAAPGAEALVRVGELSSLRAALTTGADAAEIDRLLGMAPARPELRDVRDLWKAEHLFATADLNAVETLLGRFPSPAPYPAADLLRARLAFRRLQREGIGKAYERAIDNGLDHDGLRLESVVAQGLTDDVIGAEVAVDLMVEMGSRSAHAWYAAAEVALGEDRLDEAERLLRAAWQLEPVRRQELFAEPAIAALAARPAIFPLFELGSPEEPRVPPAGARRPIALPAGTSAATCGQSLRLMVGSAELLVPGGALLAPDDAVLEDAEAWSRHGEARAMAALPSLMASAAAGESLSPRRLRLSEEAGGVLAEQNRWQELISLTEAVSRQVESSPAILVRLRARALRQVGRKDEARALLMRLAGSDIANRRPTPGTLFELAELFAAAGEYETAIKLSRKADSQLPVPRGELRRRQMELDKELSASYATYSSAHFDVRYPEATGETYARGIALVLEEERTRLLRWIPNPGKARIEVHLFPLQQFFGTFGSEYVIGLYDGKVRVPFADLQSLHPELVQILSHEVAHAMIAGATRDQAPHWLQEGLAQHVEMGVGRINPLPDLARTGRALSFPTLEPILSGFAEPQLVDLGYAEAAWSLHFIESRFGVKAIHGLLAAFAAGSTTGQALQQVTRLSPAGLDRELWRWGTSEAPQSWSLDVRRYDLDYESKLLREQGRSRENGPAAAAVVGEKTTEEPADELVEGREDEIRRKMNKWYGRYTQRAAGVKQALKPLVEPRRPGAPPVDPALCDSLVAEASRALAELPLWTCPDSNVNRTLRGAFQTFVEIGKSCQQRRPKEMAALIAHANEQLARAAQLLEPYGMTP